ncbi:VPS35 endosomal protein-sorting factor-like isoform X3 [Leptinotarsa decemlineata]|uniref:VPS35 endosomal protein-sorting factor-like isoform X3 n=1 Tax=Leptinotarsa decemlineata TaxID=7539 RepID=UPI003D306166
MGDNLVEWKTLIYDLKKAQLHKTQVVDHPLKNVVVTERIPRKILGSTSSTGRTTPVSTPASILEPLTLALRQLDPLSEFALQDMDPLSKMAAEMDMSDTKLSKMSAPKETEDNVFGNMESWSSRKSAILSKYTTSEKLTMVTSFLSEGEKVTVKAQTTAVDKVQHRLKQLDSFEEASQQTLDLSQAEYVMKIEQLNQELVSAWNTEQRVKALKIAIQCAKLLTDTDVLPFYPSKFVLITDILDTFGKLVYDRLRIKANYYKPGSKIPTSLPEDFTPDMVPDTAKETCLNWFYKIASIRELVPRLYVELALLKSYNFVSTNEFSESLPRITDMIHGVGNPLVAVYLRCYLCKTGMTTTNMNTDFSFLLSNFTGFLDSYQHLFSRGVEAELHVQKMDMSTYVTLYTPALNFILEAVACKVKDSILPNLLNVCREYKNSSLILNTIMSGLKPSYISERCLEFLEMMVNCSDQGIPLYVLLRTLGLCVSVCPPPSEQRKQILNIVWKFISSFSKPNEFIACAEAWVQYVVLYFSQVNALSVNTRLVIKGIHTRKTADFVRACAAYCFITIPSILSEKTRLELYLLSGQVALFNQCLGQADACLKAALAMLAELSKASSNSEIFLASYIKQFLSTLLVVPDNPERGVLSLMRGLLNVMRELDWSRPNCTLGMLYISVIDVLTAMAQEDYPYHIDKVESNDSLYGCDPKFSSEIDSICSIVIREILTLLKDLGSCKRQSQVATDLFCRVALRADLTRKPLFILALNLWQLSLKNGYADVKYMVRSREYLKQKGLVRNDICLQRLVENMVV